MIKLTEVDLEFIKEELSDLHNKSLNQKYIGWGSFMRAGIKIWQKSQESLNSPNHGKVTK